MGKFDVKIGDKFEVTGLEIETVDEVERLQSLDERRREKKREERRTNVLLAAFLFALAASGFVGWYDGTYDELIAVWSVGGGLALGDKFLVKKD